jgi:hypothetical protein
VVSFTSRPLYPRGKESSVPVGLESGWAAWACAYRDSNCDLSDVQPVVTMLTPLLRPLLSFSRRPSWPVVIEFLFSALCSLPGLCLLKHSRNQAVMYVVFISTPNFVAASRLHPPYDASQGCVTTPQPNVCSVSFPADKARAQQLPAVCRPTRALGPEVFPKRVVSTCSVQAPGHRTVGHGYFLTGLLGHSPYRVVK